MGDERKSVMGGSDNSRWRNIGEGARRADKTSSRWREKKKRGGNALHVAWKRLLKQILDRNKDTKEQEVEHPNIYKSRAGGNMMTADNIKAAFAWSSFLQVANMRNKKKGRRDICWKPNGVTSPSAKNRQQLFKWKIRPVKFLYWGGGSLQRYRSPISRKYGSHSRRVTSSVALTGSDWIERFPATVDDSQYLAWSLSVAECLKKTEQPPAEEIKRQTQQCRWQQQWWKWKVGGRGGAVVGGRWALISADGLLDPEAVFHFGVKCGGFPPSPRRLKPPPVEAEEAAGGPSARHTTRQLLKQR